MIPGDDALYLYHLTLRPKLLAPKSIAGQFSGKKKVQELVLATSNTIELYRPNAETGKVNKIMTQNAFANIQNVETLRVTDTQKDLLVITSDSGKIVIAEYKESSLRFVPIVSEPHSKNALRRISPGEYLAVNPKNRALLLGAIERTKLVYKVETENAAGAVELLLPLEISLKNVLTLSLCALDTNYENPVWAAVEIDYKDYEKRKYDPQSSPLQLNYYELDQGLNHVVTRKSKAPLPASATLLVPLPGHIGGLLVCCESYLIYEKEGKERVFLPLPVREKTEKTVIVNYFVHTLKKQDFFVLLQSTSGDLYKITVEYDPGAEKIDRMLATYFDTIPACNSINILKSGFLFANTSDNDKLFYQFEKLGDTDETTLVSVADETLLQPPVPFKPQGLQNLALVDILDSLSPLVDGFLNEQTQNHSSDPLTQLVTLSSHSYMKILSHGTQISELVALPLPLVPTNIYTTKTTSASVNDAYLVLTSSVKSQTLLLSIGEVVEEVQDSGFVIDQHTLAVQQVGHNSVVQIHTNGVRHIKHATDESGAVTGHKETDWYPPAGISVLHASANNEQVILGLSNREVCYFEIDTDEQLTEYQERLEISDGSITAVCLATGFIGGNTRKSDFAVLASSSETIQVISLQPHNCFDVISLQALSASCVSLLMMPADHDNVYLHMGLSNGIYARVSIDSISGKLSDTRLKYLGTRPVLLRSISLPGLALSAVLLISSRPWIGYFGVLGEFKLTPLLGTNITSGASLYSEDIGTESVVGISDGNMSIFTVGSEESGFNASNELNTELVKLRYSPRKQVKHTNSDTVFVIEAEYGTVSPYRSGEEVDSDLYDAFGYDRKAGTWASCLQLVSLSLLEVTQTIEFEDNECAVSLCLVDLDGSQHLVVGTSVNQTFAPPKSTGNFLYTYAVKRAKNKEVSVELVHRTPVEFTPSALTDFHGKLLACVGNQLRLYEMGKKQLLRKSLTKIDYLRRVTKISHEGGDIVVVGDSNESVSYLKYESHRNSFRPICNDVMRRQITCFHNLDHRTVVGGDKFGNIFVSRVPEEATEQMSDNVLVNSQEHYLGLSSGRLATMCEFYVGDIATSFLKGAFVTGGTESVIYTGIEGSVGMLMPLATKQECEFLMKLDALLKKHFDVCFEDWDKTKPNGNLLGREHTKYRGYYNPVKNVIDGDYVETFMQLDQATKIRIAGQLDRAPREIERRIYDLRNRAAF